MISAGYMSLIHQMHSPWNLTRRGHGRVSLKMCLKSRIRMLFSTLRKHILFPKFSHLYFKTKTMLRHRLPEDAHTVPARPGAGNGVSAPVTEEQVPPGHHVAGAAPTGSNGLCDRRLREAREAGGAALSLRSLRGTGLTGPQVVRSPV